MGATNATFVLSGNALATVTRLAEQEGVTLADALRLMLTEVGDLIAGGLFLDLASQQSGTTAEKLSETDPADVRLV